ncbi:MAG: M20/M25/M40 family metallo-hydrolase [Rhodobacteraceae bacterium]|nr:M20/M25/M40 family metallo-hydrolase [Paracoccaceae bacterium]
MTLDAVLSRVDTDFDASVARLMRLLEIPSISTDPAYAADCDAAAAWLAEDLTGIGLTASVRPTTGRAMVVGQGGDGGPHLLFYGHYDVQPADPLALWDSPPFEPRIEDGPRGKVLRGRGAADDKGQLMTFVEACRAWTAVHGALPCRLTVFFEGEEESGSPSLVPFLKDNADELSADVALICDTDMFDDTPAIVTQLRGLLGEEIIVTAANRDLHSGHYGGMAANPARVLAGILAGLHDDRGRITVPGFYDGVPPLDPMLRAQWDELGFVPGEFLGEVGLSQPAGEEGKSPLEMVWSEPTCEINGMISGYTGEGFKTVLPAQASAKLSFRLVGTQDPLAIRESFRAMVRDQIPPDCSVEFRDHGASPASHMRTDAPAFETARQALSREWEREAAFIGAGGSIPVAGYFQTHLGMDSLLIGFGRSDDAIHSPNEKYDLASFHKGIRSWVRILAALSA